MENKPENGQTDNQAKADDGKAEGQSSGLGAVWSQKSELEKTLSAGMHGAPELKRDEKALYLGEFRERVIRTLTKEQVMESDIYKEIEEALRHPKAAKIVLSGLLDEHYIAKYERLASQQKKLSVTRKDAEFKGDIGLLVAANEAVDIESVEVQNRTERLRAAGLTDLQIRAKGKKICKKCYDQICEAAPELAGDYKVLTAFDRLLGEQCPAH